jgi:alanyl-tRNA synthetase
VPAERIIRIGDNKRALRVGQLLEMGDTGPCGPCTEIFYDHGPDVWGGPPGSPEEDGDRYIEIWNLVFMQFNRDAQGNMTRLPKQSVDTGMGLERLAAVLQHVHSNYEIDLFQNLIKAAARVTETADLNNNSLKVIADHIRACSFLIVDGVIPGNEGRGYVLRRIVRRAIRHGYKLGRKGAFFHKLVADLVAEMGAAYPELGSRAARDRRAAPGRRALLRNDRARDVDPRGGARRRGEGRQGARRRTCVQAARHLRLPARPDRRRGRERGMTVDEPAFDAAMARQREQARAAGKFKARRASNTRARRRPSTATRKSRSTTRRSSRCTSMGVGRRSAGRPDAVVVLDNTPFYAESGGQVGDQGVLVAAPRFAVADTLKIQADVFGHHGTLDQGTLKVGDVLRARSTRAPRPHVRNHSATHLMHKALREVLGARAAEGLAGRSGQDPLRLRAQRAADRRRDPRVEQIVNAEILANADTCA